MLGNDSDLQFSVFRDHYKSECLQMILTYSLVFLEQPGLVCPPHSAGIELCILLQNDL